MMNKSFKYLLIVISMLMLFPACSILDQTSEMKTFTQCEFRLVDVDNIILAGIDVQDVRSASDLSFTEATNISMAALSGKLPLGLTANIEVRNPNPSKASMNSLYWKLFIDDIEITDGRVGEKVSVPADGGVASMPVDIQVDLFEVLQGESSDAIINFGMNLAGTGESSSRVKLKIKPNIVVGMTKVPYPGYFTIEEEFVSQ